jgi:hypothetical protein
MARRRHDGGIPHDEFVMDDGFGGTREEQGLGGGDGYQDPPPLSGDDLIRKIEEDAALGAFDNPIAGNTVNPRDLRPAMPNMIGQAAAPAPFALPQGVSVNDAIGDDGGGGGTFAQDTPAMPMTPTPGASPQGPVRVSPSMPPRPTSTGSAGPMRVSAAPSALFGQSGGASMFGRADGLLGGGRGVVGGDDGEIEPTEMYRKLLQMFGAG